MPNLTFTTRGALRKSTMRLANESLALNTIRQNPGISRSDLARITGMSPSSITFIVYRLKRRKIVLEDKIVNHTRVGRRPTGLHLAEKARMAIAVEVSLHGCRVALIDLGGNLVVDRLVPWQPNAEILTQHLQAVIHSFLRQLKRDQILGVAVGIPGTFDRATGKIIAAENLGWFNVEFGRLLSGKLSLPFCYENNSRLSALAERFASRSLRHGRRIRTYHICTRTACSGLPRAVRSRKSAFAHVRRGDRKRWPGTLGRVVDRSHGSRG